MKLRNVLKITATKMQHIKMSAIEQLKCGRKLYPFSNVSSHGKKIYPFSNVSSHGKMKTNSLNAQHELED